MVKNIFELSQKELSQDAFFAWFFQFADKNNCNEYLKESTLDEKTVLKIGECASELLSVFTGIQDLKISSIEIFKQWEKIDLWISINDRYSLIIEDKTSTSEHDDQLDRYRAIAHKWCDENNHQLFCCYYKTESFPLQERRAVERKGYAVFERKDVLMVFDKYIESIRSNDIIAAYYQFLYKKETQEELYLKLSIDKWEWYQYVGFFKSIDCFFSYDTGLEWGYVPNQAGGFIGLWWHFCQMSDNVIYLQFEEQKLCIKIGDVLENHSEIRQEVVNKINSLASQRGIFVNKPPRYGTGTAMTVGIIDENCWLAVTSDGLIDLQSTEENLIKLTQFIDLVAK